MKKNLLQFMRMYRGISIFFSVSFVLLMLIISFVSTCTMRSDYHETTFFVESSIIFKLCFFLLIIYILQFGRPKWIFTFCNRLDTDTYSLNRTIKIILLILFFVAAFWVCFMRPTVISDQGEILTAAEQMNYHDYSCVKPGGYLARYPHQIGSTIMVALIQRIAGRDNYFLFQILNAGMATLCLYYLSRLAGHMQMSGSVQVAVLLLGILFFPFLFYATFIYSTIPSLLFSIISYNLFAEYESDLKIIKAFLCALSLSFAIFLKMNALIFFIAIFIHSIISAIYQKKYRQFILPLFLIIFIPLVLFLPKVLLEKITGVKMVDGISPYSYLAMGVQDGDRAPGWYNMYINTTYDNSEYDSGKQKETALRDYKQRIAYFNSNRLDGLRFFLQKIASEWNNPTFEAFWINVVRGSVIEQPGWVKRISMPKAIYIATKYLNVLQFFVWFFILVALLNSDQECTNLFYLPLLTFVGGFIFHCIWEAKCQYTLPYFVILFPYVAYGFKSLRSDIVEYYSGNIKSFSSKKYIYLVGFCAFFVLSILLLQSGLVTCDTLSFKEYLTGFN